MTTRPRVLIFGAEGQLGLQLQRSFRDFGEIEAVNRQSADLAAPDQIRAMIRRVKPDIILNAAAYTAVDRAESEPDLALAINALAPRIIAEEARNSDALLVHYSTDYVFDGEKPSPWTEADEPNPLNSYGASKLAGEQAIRQVGGKYLIFRTSWVYGPRGSNFLLTMLRLAGQRKQIEIVEDQQGSPTSTIELAKATHKILQGILDDRFGVPEEWVGLYHMSCSGSTTWYGFAQGIFARAGKLLHGKVPIVTPIASKDYATPAKRPHNSVLSNAKLEARFAVRLAPWASALDVVVQELS